MNNRPVLVFLSITILVAGLGIASALLDEPPSAFTDGGPGHDVVTAARAQDVSVRRLVAGPTELTSQASLEPGQAVYMTLGVPDGYTTGQADALKDLMEAGGTVIVADAFGHANTLTADLGVVFERVRLVQETPNVTATIDGRTFEPPLGEATALHLAPGTQATVLARSTPDSFLDRDGDGAVEGDEPHGPFPVAVEVPLGGGRLIALSSPALLGSETPSSASTARWISALLEDTANPGTTLGIDESQGERAGPAVRAAGIALAAVTSAPWSYIVILAGLSLLGGAILFAQDRDGWSAHTFRPDTLVTRADARARKQTDGDARDMAIEGSRWTDRGTIAVFGGAALAATGIAVGNAQATTAGAILLTFSARALLTTRPRVDAERTLSATSASEGVPLEAVIELANRHNRSLTIELKDDLPPTVDLVEGSSWRRITLGPRGQMSLTYTIRPSVRGPWDLGPLRVGRSDPLELRRHEATLCPPDTLTIRPRSIPLRTLPFDTKRPTATLGPHMVNRSGDGSEFHSLRDYQDGDSYRNINWKASARSTDFMVNQRVHESMTTLVLLLDVRGITGAGPLDANPIVEGSRVALSVVEAATQMRDRVRVVLYGDGVQTVPPGPREDQLHQLRRVLGEVAPAGDTTLAEAIEEVREDMKERTPVMVVSGMEDDPTVVDAVRDLRVRGMLPLLVALPLRTSGSDGDRRVTDPGADAIREDREQKIGQLRSRSVPIYDTDVGVPLEHLFRLGGAR